MLQTLAAYRQPLENARKAHAAGASVHTEAAFASILLGNGEHSPDLPADKSVKPTQSRHFFSHNFFSLKSTPSEASRNVIQQSILLITRVPTCRRVILLRFYHPAGTFTSKTGAILPSSCLICPPGSYSLAGSTVCIPCDEGTYTDENGSSVCKRCAFGHFSVKGSSSCYPCPPGTFATGTQGICEPCAPGSYAPDEAMSRCLPCDDGQVTPIFGAVNCSACSV